MDRFYAILILLALLSPLGCAPLSGLQQTPETRQLEEKAYAGDLESQYQLGLRYTIHGRWIWDYHDGYDWFMTAAERGYADAQYMVGMAKILGRGTSYDKDGAALFFRKAAEQGHVRAQYQLGLAYLNGAGVMKDVPWGRQWLEQAAWNGHTEAQFLLAAIFSGGVGGQSNKSEAWAWLKKASQDGHDHAQNALERLEKKMSAEELILGKKLFDRKPVAAGSLYEPPRIRYVQTILNQLGYRAGFEDGLEGIETRQAVADYAKQNKLPPETRLLELVETLRGSF